MKDFFANYHFHCEKCDGEIEQGDQFFFFNDNKICEECWDKLVSYFEEEM